MTYRAVGDMRIKGQISKDKEQLTDMTGIR